MANLSVYVSSYVNGVAEIHSQILKDGLFRDWYQRAIPSGSRIRPTASPPAAGWACAIRSLPS